jgi:hypothetical protein
MPSRTALFPAVLLVSLPLAVKARDIIASPPLIVQVHDIYLSLVDRWGRRCCDETDCRPAFYRLVKGRVKMFVNGEWIDIPYHTIQYRALAGDAGQTGGGHWCGFADRPSGDESLVYTTRCAILPPNTGATPDGMEQALLP